MAFYIGPFDDNSIGEPGNVCDGVSAQSVAGYVYGPGYGVLPFVTPGQEYTHGCSGEYVLHHRRTRITVGTHYCRKPCDTPPQNSYSKKQILIYQPTATAPDGISAFYTNWSKNDTVTLSGSLYTEYIYSHDVETGGYIYEVYTQTITSTQSTFIRITGGIPDDICPPGTVFNTSTGTCDVLPEYKWDGVEYVLKVPGDNGYIPPQLCDGQTITYTLKYNGNDTREYCEDRPKTFTISYAGSTLIKGIDFNGPTSISFTESGSKDFDIIIFDYAERTNGQITVNIDDPDSECPSHIQIFNIDDCVPNSIGVPEYPPGIETTNIPCCGYMPDEYDDWSSGYGVPELTAPKYR